MRVLSRLCTGLGPNATPTASDQWLIIMEAKKLAHIPCTDAYVVPRSWVPVLLLFGLTIWQSIQQRQQVRQSSNSPVWHVWPSVELVSCRLHCSAAAQLVVPQWLPA